jgi:hypothetical protein
VTQGSRCLLVSRLSPARPPARPPTRSLLVPCSSPPSPPARPLDRKSSDRKSDGPTGQWHGTAPGPGQIIESGAAMMWRPGRGDDSGLSESISGLALVWPGSVLSHSPRILSDRAETVGPGRRSARRRNSWHRCVPMIARPMIARPDLQLQSGACPPVAAGVCGPAERRERADRPVPRWLDAFWPPTCRHW